MPAREPRSFRVRGSASAAERGPQTQLEGESGGRRAGRASQPAHVQGHPTSPVPPRTPCDFCLETRKALFASLFLLLKTVARSHKRNSIINGRFPPPTLPYPLNLIINFQNASAASSRRVVLKRNWKDWQGKELAVTVLNQVGLAETLSLLADVVRFQITLIELRHLSRNIILELEEVMCTFEVRPLWTVAFGVFRGVQVPDGGIERRGQEP